MRSSSPPLQDYLRTRPQCWIAELFTLTLANGAQYFWTTFDRNLTYAGQTWIALGVQVQRSRMTVRNTVEVPELELKTQAPDTAEIGGINLKTAVHNGIFDGAAIGHYRVFMPSPGDTSLGLVTMFAGRMSQAVITASGVTFTAKGDNVLMNQQAPRNLYQTTCLHTFCDAGCTLLAANYTTANTAGFGATTTFVPWGTAPANPTLYIQGTITFSSGACIGQVRTIRNADSTGVYLTYPLYGTPQQGDTTSVLMGCSRTLTACKTHTDNGGHAVDNSQHFRGYPFVPQAEYGV